jgi:hypothetical protein
MTTLIKIFILWSQKDSYPMKETCEKVTYNYPKSQDFLSYERGR